MATYTRPLLTDDDLAALSDRTAPAAQRRWLDDNGVRYFLSRDGKPRTTWSAVDAVLVGNTTHQITGVNLESVR